MSCYYASRRFSLAIASVGEWLPEGSHLPQQQQVRQLQQICRELFELFDRNASSDTAA